jgi:hypothetical protein
MLGRHLIDGAGQMPQCRRDMRNTATWFANGPYPAAKRR